MRISGLQKVTLLDFPGHIACTVFLGGCNLRCPFCHNMELVKNQEAFPEITLDSFLDFLKGKIGKLEGVAITGGEPLMNNDIEDLIKPVKDMGFKVKLDTNGFFPDLLKKLYDEKVLDMVAMDIKSGATNYMKVAGIDNSNNMGLPENVKKSIDIIMSNEVEYEFRTTCVKGLHTEKDFYEIREIIKGAKKYFLQNYRATNEMKDLPFSPFEKQELENFISIVKDSICEVQIRGI